MAIDLAKSADARVAMLDRFGFIPESVIRDIKIGALTSSLFHYAHEAPTRRNNSVGKKRSLKVAAAAEDAGAKFQGCGIGQGKGSTFKSSLFTNVGANRMALSIMPAELVDFFIKYYGEPGQVYLDPFMGQGVQMQISHLRGLDYWGYDISHEFFQYIEAIVPKVRERGGAGTINVFEGDSRHPQHIPDGIGDFSFHSPPYWDVEFYGEESGQLGFGRTYEEFMQGMRDVAAAWLPKFKPTAWHVVNVGDMRRDNRFYAYHIDIVNAFKSAGWRLHDIWVLDSVVSGAMRMFGVDRNLKRIAPKVHEYALVFRPT